MQRQGRENGRLKTTAGRENSRLKTTVGRENSRLINNGRQGEWQTEKRRQVGRTAD
jgi:hypothetical protein